MQHAIAAYVDLIADYDAGFDTCPGSDPTALSNRNMWPDEDGQIDVSRFRNCRGLVDKWFATFLRMQSFCN